METFTGKLEVTCNVPEGYEPIAYRLATTEDTWLLQDCCARLIVRTNKASDIPVLILKKKVWIPKQGDTVWFVDVDLNVVTTVLRDNYVEARGGYYFNHGMAYKTSDQALVVARKIRKIHEDCQKEFGNV